MSKITAKSQKGQQVPNFTEDEARAYFEKLRWPNVAACVHCGSVNVYLVGGTSHRPGLYECRDCREQFTVTLGTVMEDTHLPLSVWAKAFHPICSSKKGMSALQLQRNLGLGSYRTAWFLAHRIREAMRCEPVAGMLKGEVQVDETFVGGKPRRYSNTPSFRGRGTSKQPVMVLVETGGKAHSKPIDHLTAKELKGAIRETVDKSAGIVTDENSAYFAIGKEYAGGHQTVNHSAGEYSRNGINTNTAESFFALFKRGHYGTFHKLSKKHLHRYCDEFAFRWNGRTLTDSERRDLAVKGAEGKRLMYRTPVDPPPPSLKSFDQLPPFPL
jgi:transposase-like protein